MVRLLALGRGSGDGVRVGARGRGLGVRGGAGEGLRGGAGAQGSVHTTSDVGKGGAGNTGACLCVCGVYVCMFVGWKENCTALQSNQAAASQIEHSFNYMFSQIARTGLRGVELMTSIK